MDRDQYSGKFSGITVRILFRRHKEEMPATRKELHLFEPAAPDTETLHA
jgi:hypothetical protein